MTTPESNPLIQEARNAVQQAGRELNLCDTVVIDKQLGSIRGREILVVCTPIKKDGNDKLSECYRNIYNTFGQQMAKENIQEGNLVVPCFSTGLGGIDSKISSQTAIEEAKKFLKENPNQHITFVIHRIGKEVDVKNSKAYQNEFKELSNEEKKHLHITEGQLERQEADMIVCPCRPDLDFKSVQIARAIFNAAGEKKEEEYLLTAKQEEELKKRDESLHEKGGLFEL